MSHAFVSAEGQYLGPTVVPDYDPALVRKHPNGQPIVVPLVIENEPPHSDNERLDGPHHHFEGGVMKRFWTVRPALPEELYQQEMKSTRLGRVEKVLLMELLNRIRALEGKAPVSEEQFQEFVRGLVTQKER